MKNLRVLIVIAGISILGVNKSVSQEIAIDNMSVEDRHRAGSENAVRTAQLFEARTYVSNRNETLLYRLLKPIDYDPNKKYPLVVCLSGSGGRGTDNIKQIAGCWPAQILSKQENRKKYPAFVFVPQCPPGFDWGRSFKDGKRGGRSKPGGSDLPGVDTLVFEIIKALEDEFEIDKRRLYVTGQSMGGFGSWHFILTHSITFAAAIPICGGGNPDLAQYIVDVPIWAFHGQKDETVPVDFSRNMIEAIKDVGGNPRFTEFQDAGHICWPLAFDTPGLLDWLFAQKLKQ